jgi:hypothetical protein
MMHTGSILKPISTCVVLLSVKNFYNYPREKTSEQTNCCMPIVSLKSVNCHANLIFVLFYYQTPRQVTFSERVKMFRTIYSNNEMTYKVAALLCLTCIQHLFCCIKSEI